MTLNIFVQHFVNALSLGSLYGLIAVGYTMVYGILRLINFAHGDIFMLGAYFVYFATIVYRLPWVLGVALAVAATPACGARRASPRSSAPSASPSSSRTSPSSSSPECRAPWCSPRS